MMRTGASGMNAQSNRLGAVSDNIANASTTGYKAASTEFASLLISSSATSYTSGGVETSVRYGISNQGALTFTASPFDLAVNGGGFMLVEGSDGAVALTRAGAFVPNAEGELVNAGGFRLLGMPIKGSGGAQVVINGTAGLVPVNVQSNRLVGEASTSGLLTANLPATASTVPAADLPSANAATSQSTAKSSIVVYGNLGEEVILDLHFTKTVTPGEWEVAVFDADDRAVGGGFPYANAALTSAILSFDSLGGSAGPGTITIPVPGGAMLELDVSGMSQLAADYAVLEVNANGNAPGDVKSIEIAGDGIVYETFENGTRRAAYRIPLATVVSPDQLSPKTGNVFEVSSASGDLRVGVAGTSGFGDLVSGALENSTVDLAGELTEMIEAQRNYTANSRVFQTGTELLEVLVNLKR